MKSEYNFLSKIVWEGGIFEALEYGLDEKDLPKGELKENWKNLRKLYNDMLPHLDKINEVKWLHIM